MTRFISAAAWSVWFMKVAIVTSSSSFTYLDDSTDAGYGIREWNKVNTKESSFPWERYDTRMNDGNLYDDLDNECKWKAGSTSSHQQSPIDVYPDEGTDCNKEIDDQHRWWMEEGNCKWSQVEWGIEPWGLSMVYPTKKGGSDPSDDVCKKPNLDSSGGFGDRWFMNHMTLKSPSEHFVEGKQYDAEINFAHFRYRRREDLGFIISILCEARVEYPDNPILQPYLESWEAEWKRIEESCTTKAPTASPAPSMTPPPMDQFSLSTSTARGDMEASFYSGVFFDLQVSDAIEEPIRIDAIGMELNEASVARSTGNPSVDLYTKERSHVGDVRRSDRWTLLGSYTVDQDSKIQLSPSLELQPSEERAFYIVSTDAKKLLSGFNLGRDARETEQGSTDQLQIFVGTGVNGGDGPFDANTVERGTGFLGTIYYSVPAPFSHEAVHIEEDEEAQLETSTNGDANTSVPFSNEAIKIEEEEVAQLESTEGVNATLPFSNEAIKIEEEEEELASMGDGYESCATHAQLTVSQQESLVAEKSIMFEVVVKNDLILSGLDLVLLRDFVENGGVSTQLEVFVRNGTMPNFIDATNMGEWTSLGSYDVIGLGVNTHSGLDLYEPLKLTAGATITLWVVQIDGGSDLGASAIASNPNSTITDEDDNLQVHAGKGQDEELVVDAPANSVRAFAGALHYSLCGESMNGSNHQQDQRQLDHRFKSRPDDVKEWNLAPYFDPYRLVPSPWFYKYTGSFTMPLCTEGTHWRIVDKPLQISTNQLLVINQLIVMMRDETTCERATVGRPRDDNSGFVNVNRPLQGFAPNRHKLQYCGTHSWKSQGFFNTPRGNTCWQLLDNKSKCDLDGYGQPQK